MSPALHLIGVLADVPVEPDAETARTWLRAELADPIYTERPDLLAQILDWILDQLSAAEDAISGVDPRAAALVVALVVLVGVGVALLIAGPVRRSRRARQSAEVFGDDTRSAAELRSAADAAAAQGRWTDAVLDRFRAVLRSLEDRVVLEPRPGRTAHEAAEVAGARLPTVGDDLRQAAVLFDDVCYGDAEASAQDDAWLRTLDARVAAARPARPEGTDPDDDLVPVEPTTLGVAP